MKKNIQFIILFITFLRHINDNINSIFCFREYKYLWLVKMLSPQLITRLQMCMLPALVDAMFQGQFVIHIDHSRVCKLDHQFLIIKLLYYQIITMYVSMITVLLLLQQQNMKHCILMTQYLSCKIYHTFSYKMQILPCVIITQRSNVSLLALYEIIQVQF